MRTINIFNVCLFMAFGVALLPISQEMAVASVAEKMSNIAADQINETPQVEEKGGIRQQILHKGANLATSSLVERGASMILTTAAKYPLVAVAAPVALPVAKAIAGAVILNQVHKKINGMFDDKNSTSTPEEMKAEEEARNERGEKAAGVLTKVTSFFNKDEETKDKKKTEASEASNPDDEGESEEATEEAKPKVLKKEETKKKNKLKNEEQKSEE